ncbi:unnamed protein product, partial [Candidula unifasciata]
DKLRAPVKKHPDLSHGWKRPTEPADKTVAPPCTAPSSTKFEVHRQDTGRLVNTASIESRPWLGKTGAKAFLLQK